VYALTEKGVALAPILVEMILWSARYEKTAAPPAQLRQIRADKEAFVASIRAALSADREPV
jgi:DNA-binding HxlR family transcriptional regulator